MPRLQLEPGELGHQIQFRRPDVPVRAAKKLCLRAGAEGEVVRDDPLAQHVIGVQADVARFGGEDGGLLARWQLAQLWYPQLDDEPAAGRQVPGGVAEA